MMPSIKRIDHIAILVDEIHEALTFWRDTLGFQLDHLEEVPEQQAEVAFIPVSESELELVRPTTEDSGIARFLKKRGPGIHHICFEVDDLEACLSRLKERGVRMINPEPVPGAEGKIAAFIHPESAGGVLIELCEWPSKE